MADIAGLVENETINTCDDRLFGDHETQESEGGEGELHKHFKHCKKNPGHVLFIPVHDLKLSHLPLGYRHYPLFDYIISVASLTVRIAVEKSSKHRPIYWPNTKQRYPFHCMRSRRNLRTGSGKVYGKVFKFTKGCEKYGGKHSDDRKRCWCKKCQQSGKPRAVWWEFYVETAAHVVFDDYEARHTSLRLFYDREDSPVISVDMVVIDKVVITSDVCRLRCVTCDRGIAKKLKFFCIRHYVCWKNVCERYTEFRDEHRINFIVSHPHGCSKSVSFGRWTAKNVFVHRGFDLKQFIYTTCTCPGSSGASVHCVGYWWGWGRFFLIHTGSVGHFCNHSGIGDLLCVQFT